MRGFILLVLICSTVSYWPLDAHSQVVKEKNSKISSALSYALGKPDSGEDTMAFRSLQSTVKDADDDGRIRVDIRLYEFSEESLVTLGEEGVAIEIYDESQNLIQGKVAKERVENISNLSIVKFVDLPNIGFTNVGSVWSEGDAVLKADVARAAFGVDGSGIKVGVASVGIYGLTESVASEDIPPAGVLVPSSPLAEGGVSVLAPCPAFTAITKTPVDRPDLINLEGRPFAEGLALLELVHDIAPGAELFFAPGAPTPFDFIRAKKCLTEIVDIIADDIGFINNGPYDGTSPASLASTASVKAGVANFIAVGNEAEIHYQALFTDTEGDGFNEFDVSLGIRDGDPTKEYPIKVEAGRTAVVQLQWNDPWGASKNDYDLIAVFPDGSTLTSDNIQNGDDNPVEEIEIKNLSETEPLLIGIKIMRVGRAQPRELDLFHGGAEAVNTDFVVPRSSVANNADAYLATAIGAISYSGDLNPDDLLPDEIRPYSSRGPTSDGRMKPNLVVPDAVSITGHGGFGFKFEGRTIFVGTSAAAPQAAGVAALLLQAHKKFTPEAFQQSRTLSPFKIGVILSKTAKKLGRPRPNNTFGFGRIDAFAAIQYLLDRRDAKKANLPLKHSPLYPCLLEHRPLSECLFK